MSGLAERVKEKDWSVTAEIGPEAGPLLLPLLADADPQVRELAVTCLHRAGGEAARRGLLQAVRDPIETVRGAAAAFLRSHFTPEDIPAIEQALSESPDDNVRVQLAILLGVSGDAAVIPFLLERLELEKDQRAHRAASLALARLREPSQQQELIARLQREEDPGRKVTVLESLLYVNDRKLLAQIVPLLEDKRLGSNIGPAHLPYYIRVCDVVVNVAYQMLGGPYESRRHVKPYSDWELEEAREAMLARTG